MAIYCRFGNFRENFIFANSIKRHISDVKKSRLRIELPIPGQSYFAIARGFYCHESSHMQSFMKIKSSRKFPHLQYLIGHPYSVLFTQTKVKLTGNLSTSILIRLVTITYIKKF